MTKPAPNRRNCCGPIRAQTVVEKGDGKDGGERGTWLSADTAEHRERERTTVVRKERLESFIMVVDVCTVISGYGTSK